MSAARPPAAGCPRRDWSRGPCPPARRRRALGACRGAHVDDRRVERAVELKEVVDDAVLDVGVQRERGQRDHGEAAAPARDARRRARRVEEDDSTPTRTSARPDGSIAAASTAAPAASAAAPSPAAAPPSISPSQRSTVAGRTLREPPRRPAAPRPSPTAASRARRAAPSPARRSRARRARASSRWRGWRRRASPPLAQPRTSPASHSSRPATTATAPACRPSRRAAALRGAAADAAARSGGALAVGAYAAPAAAANPRARGGRCPRWGEDVAVAYLVAAPHGAPDEGGVARAWTPLVARLAAQLRDRFAQVVARAHREHLTVVSRCVHARLAQLSRTASSMAGERAIEDEWRDAAGSGGGAARRARHGRGGSALGTTRSAARRPTAAARAAARRRRRPSSRRGSTAARPRPRPPARAQRAQRQWQCLAAPPSHR